MERFRIWRKAFVFFLVFFYALGTFAPGASSVRADDGGKQAVSSYLLDAICDYTNFSKVVMRAEPLAENEGFEPSVPCGITSFQD